MGSLKTLNTRKYHCIYLYIIRYYRTLTLTNCFSMLINLDLKLSFLWLSMLKQCLSSELIGVILTPCEFLAAPPSPISRMVFKRHISFCFSATVECGKKMFMLIPASLSVSSNYLTNA